MEKKLSKHLLYLLKTAGKNEINPGFPLNICVTQKYTTENCYLFFLFYFFSKIKEN